eukprot:CAMPEP_0170340254 /NCGR_PEP_ID=MMETSP0116_2-20130129/71227_1 /TAXON_ID=400756 /ORGANISM="Durinskia baltica, Strain CSIRO CS-38" /LENGTH=105 /DNA_ID=CAMNT_0010593757 /DNA_START=26 /DNA_END=339 /DNA_ORIENTATION=-
MVLHPEVVVGDHEAHRDLLGSPGARSLLPRVVSLSEMPLLLAEQRGAGLDLLDGLLMPPHQAQQHGVVQAQAPGVLGVLVLLVDAHRLLGELQRGVMLPPPPEIA